MANQIKAQLFKILYTDADEKNFWYRLDDYIITGLIILNVIAIVIESFLELDSPAFPVFHAFEFFSVVFFSIEYLIRVWIADLRFTELTKWQARKKYIFSFLGMIDLLSILPFYTQMFIKLDLRFLRVLRLLRILKLSNYSKSIQLVGDAIKDKKDELLTTLFGTFFLLLITSTLMYEIEHSVQPDKFPNIFAAFWWSVATLTTIGYGDVFPITGWGQFLAAVTAIFGIGLVAIPTGILSVSFLEKVEESKQKEQVAKDKEKKFTYCPHCGEKLK